MRKNLKIFVIVIAFVMLVSMACGSTPTPPANTPTYQPTFTLQPTYTPYPTFTPFPTQTSTPIVLPTQKPTQTSVPSTDYVEVDCPTSVDIPAGLDAKCYALSINPVAVGMTFYSNGELVAANVTWQNSAPESVSRKAATFLVLEAQKGGWDINDLQRISERLPNTAPDVTIREGTLQAVWTKSDEYTSITYGLISFFGN